jgi:hypothetical protein
LPLTGPLALVGAIAEEAAPDVGAEEEPDAGATAAELAAELAELAELAEPAELAEVAVELELPHAATTSVPTIIRPRAADVLSRMYFPLFWSTAGQAT